MKGQPEWLQSTFGRALSWGADAHGESLAVVHGEERLSFAALSERSRAFARGLVELGVQPGEKVSLWMSDCVAWLVARWAVPSIGAVLVPINTRFRDQDARYVLAQSDSETLIIQDRAAMGANYLDTLAKVEPACREQREGDWRSTVLPKLRRVILHSRDGGTLTGFTDFDAIEARGRALLADGELDRRIAAVRPDDVAQILYTSGTTSFPKGAMVCHGPLLQNNRAAADILQLTPADRYLACVPLFTATGTFYTLSLWMAGAAMVIADRFDAEQFCDMVQRERITLSFFVDTIVQDLRAFPGRGRYDLSSLRTGTGAPLPEASFRWLTDEIGIPELVSAYGMSESSNAVARTGCDDPFDKRASTCGRPVPGVRIKIADVDTGEDLGTGRVGEICIHGYVVMKGYYQLPDEDAKAIDADGWLHSGDLGELDSDGYLIYRGRVKEMIKPGGFNVATQEIELFLKSFPGVRQAAVVGVPDARLGEVAYAYVEALDDEALHGDTLIGYCREHIASYKVPRYVELVSEWPLTGSQKIRKLELKERALRTIEARRAETVGGPE
ncbi:AMP-binding protein [Variovorax sp. KK3]|uniref:AMP-binding protein n=1 Tax=Variovorax sp. KK3 TaxID=1855728 RepID=UPI00097C4521|nr:AMP-binding protein [Variovorax sp. KK3]